VLSVQKILTVPAKINFRLEHHILPLFPLQTVVCATKEQACL
jgi:hypothetical protein